MSVTTDGATLTAEHRALQLALRSAMLRDLLLLWPLFEVTDFGSFDAFATLATTLVISGNQDSAGLAASYLSSFRLVEGETEPLTPTLASSPDRAVVGDELRATGLLGVLNARRAGFGVSAAKQNGWVRLAGSAGSMVLNGGRQTILETTSRDPQARARWHRITSGDPCAFCRMLASRGAVYGPDTASFQAHDHCSCFAEPAYPGSQPTALASRFRSEWEQATAGRTDQLNAYREFIAAGGA